MEFDLATFALHLAAMELAVQIKAEKALEHTAELIEKTAKEELGHYQPAVGPFQAWPALAPGTLAHHAALGVGDSPLLVTGELYASIQHESSGNEAVIGSKMDIGAYQEFGTDKIPPRPFMGPAAFVNKEKIERIMARGVVAGILGGNALLIDE
jgi:HK97 gp10 family phage protein